MLLLGTMLGTATAQTITGKVTDPSHQPIDGATVVLQTLDSVFVEATITNTDGTFLLNHQPTRYRLLFQHLLYETLEKREAEEMSVHLCCSRKTTPFRKSW